MAASPGSERAAPHSETAEVLAALATGASDRLSSGGRGVFYQALRRTVKYGAGGLWLMTKSGEDGQRTW